MDYITAALIGAGLVGAALAWGWRGARREEMVTVPVSRTRASPTLAHSAPAPARAVVRGAKPRRPVSAASAASARLDDLVKANRERRSVQNGIRSPRQS